MRMWGIREEVGGLFSHQVEGSAKGYWRCRLNEAARSDERNWDGKTDEERDIEIERERPSE